MIMVINGHVRWEDLMLEKANAGWHTGRRKRLGVGERTVGLDSDFM